MRRIKLAAQPFAFLGMLPLALCLSWGVPGTAEESAAGKWLKLFDGESLFGWHATSDANWHVVDGSIAVDRGDAGFLMSNMAFGNFQLELDFRAPSTTNSGVFLRSTDDPTSPTDDCYEVNIAGESHPFPLGSLVARQRVGEIHASNDAWQTLTIRAEGGRIEVTIDDQRVTEYDDPRPILRGKIGLQFNQGPIRFRRIRLQPLGMQSLFNGQDLRGWREHPQLAGSFDVAAGELRVRGGLGQLETESSFDDFLLQAECRTHKPLVNSGIFFRCIPGETMMGYESQIHHGYQDGDPTRPTDGGTGAIFRRQDARRVVSRDLDWFDMSIAAVEDQFAVWVNGWQVTSWRDTRPPSDNPRLGQRLSAGTIIIQAHDPAADVSFRNLRIARLAR